MEHADYRQSLVGQRVDKDERGSGYAQFPGPRYSPRVPNLRMRREQLRCSGDTRKHQIGCDRISRPEIVPDRSEVSFGAFGYEDAHGDPVFLVLIVPEVPLALRQRPSSLS